VQKHFELTRARLNTFLRPNQLGGKLYTARAPVRLTVWRAPGRVSYAEAVRGKYRPARIGEKFGPLWATAWFRVDFTIPRDWRGREVHFLWNSGSEACVWMDGVPLQGLTGSASPGAFSPEQSLRGQFILTRRARGGDRHTFYVEQACNLLFGAQGSPDSMGLLRQAEIATFDRAAWDLLWDYTVVANMATQLPADSPRAAQALWTANAMINVCDLADPATWPAARRLARRFLAAKNGDGQHNLSAIGHAHIDTAWLWPLAETVRKCYRTFATAVRYMDQYPEYKFVCSQAQQYAWMKAQQPALYAKIKRQVAAGRFIPAGGTWIEPDCNIPSGESLVRQFLVGQRFFKKEFGRYCREFWNPDVFGYNGQLPQIMRGAGITRFLTQKLSWNQMNKPPAHTFWWEGIDGSRVLTHFPPADTYNGNGSVKQLIFNVKNYKDLERSNESYYLFGHGDGGGGPTYEMLEQLRRVRDTDGLPRVVQRSPEEFFTRLEADMKPLTTQVGELYFELHRGTYTTQAKNKLANRRSEELLHDVEFLSAITGRYPRAALAHLWELVLLNQFHDIIPGSSITEVYKDSAAHYAEILRTGQQLRAAALAKLVPAGTARVAAVNTLGFPRREVVTVDGQPALVTAPALGYAVQTPVTKTDRPVTLTVTASGFVLENEFLRATVRRDGHLTSLTDKRTGRETITGLANHFVLYDDVPANWDAWDMDVYHLEKRREIAGAASGRVVTKHPLRVTLEFAVPMSATSRLKLRVTLEAGTPRLDFACDVDWNEANKFLKVEFPTPIRSDVATYEIQFGHLPRPTHFNTSFDIARFEGPAQRWADLSEPGCGLALLNDCKYGYATHRNVMRLSLLRAPKSPDPVADIGRHQFRYALAPHAGDFRAAGIIHAARAFNQPLLVQKTNAAPVEKSFFQVNNPAVVIDTVKQAEDSRDIVVRLYEAHGAHSRVQFRSALPVKSVTRCNLLEEPEAKLSWRDGVRLHLGPFEIVTLKLRG
jgi:alpha-mannosidase